MKNFKQIFKILLVVFLLVVLWSPLAFSATLDEHGMWTGTVPGPFTPAWAQGCHSGYSTKLYTVTLTNPDLQVGGGCSGAGNLCYATEIDLYNYCQADTIKHYFSYSITENGSYNSATYDFDGDGIKDNVDPDPDGYNADTDGDGIIDDYDPFPNDDDCPNNGSWFPVHEWHKADGSCVYTVYQDNTGTCGRFFHSTCGSSDTEKLNSGDHSGFSLFLNIGDKGQTFEELGFGESGGAGGGGGTYSKGNESAATTGGVDGSTNPSTISDSDLQKLGKLLDGIQKVSGMNNQQLADIKKILGGAFGYNGTIEGTDTGATVGDAVKQGVEDAIDDKMDDPGDTGIPGDPNAEDLEAQANSGNPDEETYDDMLETEKTNLEAYIDDWLESSPIYELISGSEITADLGSCSMNCEVWGQEVSFSFCDQDLIDFLDLLGTFIFSISCLYSVIIIFGRG